MRFGGARRILAAKNLAVDPEGFADFRTLAKIKRCVLDMNVTLSKIKSISWLAVPHEPLEFRRPDHAREQHPLRLTQISEASVCVCACVSQSF